MNSAHIKQLQYLKSNLSKSNMENIELKIRKANDYSIDMRNAYKEANNIDIKAQYDLAKGLQKHNSLWTANGIF